MLIQASGNASVIEQLKAHLKAQRYAPSTQQIYPPLAQRFLDFL